MPELPEVETVARGLQAVLPGKRILETHFGKTDFIVNPQAIEEKVPGSQIKSIRRFGKFLLMDLELGPAIDSRELCVESLLIHLGMTGQLLVCSPDVEVAPHTHVFFSLDDGRELRYTDVRRFGRMQLLQNAEREEALAQFGLDPLEATEPQFCAQIGARLARIKALLLDQTVLRGIGNIYADESLWRARINPMKIAANLKRPECNRLYRAVQRVLREAIGLRGSSVSNYVDSQGLPGEFQFRHRVYQRHGKACSRCGTLIRRAIVAGRSSHFCPKCQPVPRSTIRRTRRAHRQR